MLHTRYHNTFCTKFYEYPCPLYEHFSIPIQFEIFLLVRFYIVCHHTHQRLTVILTHFDNIFPNKFDFRRQGYNMSNHS
eukprot:UN24035